MYLAELHGKLSPKTERLEDLLTSNVFSFFKYSDREVFLKEYLRMLGFSVSSKEAREAEFMFWPRYEQNTEPDLVIRVGKYYILVEAKYFSDFDEGNNNIKPQLVREIECGSLDAKNYSQEFYLVAITADYYRKEHKFRVIPRIFRSNFKWTSWQKIASFLELSLEKNPNINKKERDFALDLRDLLDRKNLRSFGGYNCFVTMHALSEHLDNIFFEAITAIFRGGFIGFAKSLSYTREMRPLGKTLFWDERKKTFTSLKKIKSLAPAKSQIFYERILEND